DRSARRKLLGSGGSRAGLGPEIRTPGPLTSVTEADTNPIMIWKFPPLIRAGEVAASDEVDAANALLLARVGRGIDVGDGERTLAVDLNNRLARSPGIVVHLGCRLGNPAGPQRYAFLGVELVSHADVERARNHRDVFRRRMIVRRDLVACGHLQP